MAETCSWIITWYNLIKYEVVYDYTVYILYYNFMLEVNVQKMKALTVKVHKVTLVKVGRIWCALC